VTITDVLAATALPADDGHHHCGDLDRDAHEGSLERFVTLQASRSGEVYRGVAFAPTP
jgi:hypothetical protein